MLFFLSEKLFCPGSLSLKPFCPGSHPSICPYAAVLYDAAEAAEAEAAGVDRSTLFHLPGDDKVGQSRRTS
jgi:hypothetical protein